MTPTPASSQAFHLTCLGKVRGQRQLQRGSAPLGGGLGRGEGGTTSLAHPLGAVGVAHPAERPWREAVASRRRLRGAEAMLAASPANHSARPEALWPVHVPARGWGPRRCPGSRRGGRPSGRPSQPGRARAQPSEEGRREAGQLQSCPDWQIGRASCRERVSSPV